MESLIFVCLPATMMILGAVIVSIVDRYFEVKEYEIRQRYKEKQGEKRDIASKYSRINYHYPLWSETIIYPKEEDKTTVLREKESENE